MKIILRLEEAAMLFASVYLIYRLHMHLHWWLYIILFFSPDIGMLGYLVNAKAGSITYNLFHHKGLALAICGIGLMVHGNGFVLAGLMLFAHSSFDRILGYGLKYADDFKHTSLGML